MTTSQQRPRPAGHITVVLNSGTREIVRRFDTDISLGDALRVYAEELGVDDPDIKRTPFGYRMATPVGDFRATYRRP